MAQRAWMSVVLVVLVACKSRPTAPADRAPGVAPLTVLKHFAGHCDPISGACSGVVPIDADRLAVFDRYGLSVHLGAVKSELLPVRGGGPLVLHSGNVATIDEVGTVSLLDWRVADAPKTLFQMASSVPQPGRERLLVELDAHHLAVVTAATDEAPGHVSVLSINGTAVLVLDVTIPCSAYRAITMAGPGRVALVSDDRLFVFNLQETNKTARARPFITSDPSLALRPALASLSSGRLAVVDRQNRVLVFDLRGPSTGAKPVRVTQPVGIINVAPTALANDMLAVVNDTGQLMAFDFSSESAAPFATVDGLLPIVGSPVWLGGSLVLVASADRLRIFDATAMAKGPVHQLGDLGSIVTRPTLLRDNTIVVTAAPKGTFVLSGAAP